MGTELLEKNILNSEGNAYREATKRSFIICLALTQLGFFYNVQAVTALQKPLQEVLSINEFQYSLIILAQSLPNIGLPIIIGIVIDRYGASLGLSVGMFFGVVGQLLLTIAIYSRHYVLFLIGTIMCYIGVELLFLGKSKMVRLWYKDSEIPGVTSVSIFIQSMGVILCDVTYPTIYASSNDLGLPFAIGLGACSVSLVAGTIQIFQHQKYLSLSPSLTANQEHQSLRETWNAVKSFPALFWIVTLTSATSYGAFNATKAFESKFLMISFNFTIDKAGLILASGLVATGIFAPLAGIVLDKTGKLAKGTIIAAITILIGIIINAALPECDRCLTPTIPFMLMVLGSGVRGIVIISSCLRLVPPNHVGVALAMLTCIVSSVNVGYPPVAGAIAQATIKEYKYFWVFVANSVVAVVGVCLAISVHVLDMKGSRKLQNNDFRTVSRHASYFAIDNFVERSIHDPNIKGLTLDDSGTALLRSKTESDIQSIDSGRRNHTVML